MRNAFSGASIQDVRSEPSAAPDERTARRPNSFRCALSVQEAESARMPRVDALPPASFGQESSPYRNPGASRRCGQGHAPKRLLSAPTRSARTLLEHFDDTPAARMRCAKPIQLSRRPSGKPRPKPRFFFRSGGTLQEAPARRLSPFGTAPASYLEDGGRNPSSAPWRNYS